MSKKSRHIQYLLEGIEDETVGYIPEKQDVGDYIKQCNPRMIVNYKEKPYHYSKKL